MVWFWTRDNQDLTFETRYDNDTSEFVVALVWCLAGDVFGTYEFPEALTVGRLIAFADAADYTIVKKNWFNGLAMPSIVVRRLDGRVDVVRTFDYQEYVASLS